MSLLYRLFFAFLYLISLLPFWVLHRFSWLVYVLVYKLMGYRKKVVFENLRNAFPQKSEQELQKIAQDFYLHLSDLLIESVKGVSMSLSDFEERYRLENLEELLNRVEKGQNVLLVSPHTGNWEWVFALVEKSPIDVFAVYQPLKNPHFDAYIRETRQRYGAKMISMKETFRRILEMHHSGEQMISWFAADQSCRPQKAQWVHFLEQDTGFHAGYEKIARETQQAVLFLDIEKVGRSRYQLRFIPICDDPNTLPEGEIVRTFAALTERRIRKTPAAWLWSHRRWKHKRPDRGTEANT